MKLLDVFFSFEGRLGRSSFFAYIGTMGFLLLSMAALGFWLLSSGMAVAFLYGILLFGLALLAGLWSGAALITRRLHDMDLTAAHAMCVYGINLFAICFAVAKPSIGVALTVFVEGASIWFLLSAGSPGRNRYGRAAGTLVPQSRPVRSAAGVQAG